MNMISTGTFQTEMDTLAKKESLVKKLVTAQEKKNASVARAGSLSLMALFLRQWAATVIPLGRQRQ